MHHISMIYLITNVQSFYSLTTGISGGCNEGIVDESRLVLTDSDTNTDTADVNKTVNQIQELYNAGSELVRVTVNNIESAKAITDIKNI